MIKKMLIGVIAGFSMLASTAFAEITVVNPQQDKALQCGLKLL